MRNEIRMIFETKLEVHVLIYGQIEGGKIPVTRYCTWCNNYTLNKSISSAYLGYCMYNK